MIPKIIHYCWFGKGKMPKGQIKYISEWKKLMPEYKFICWNEDNIDLNISPFLSQAYESGKFAFVADYTRLYALYTIGGIYMDTDVSVKRKFDDFLKYSLFTSYEFHPKYREYDKMLSMIDNYGNRITKDKNLKIPGVGLMSAIIAAEKGCSLIKDCLDMYENMTYKEAREKNYTIPSTLAITAEKYGFRYVNEFQLLDGNIAIFPSNVFADYRTATKDSVAIHNVAGSWSDNKTIINNLKCALYRNKIIRMTYMNVRNLFEKNPIKY